MSISKETVKYVARLSRIELKANELEKLSAQLESILDFIDKLKKIDTKDISPTSHILPINNVLREDEISPSLSCDEALKDVPHRVRNFFGVPKVIE